MNKFLTVTAILLGLTASFAQNSKIPKGVYKTNQDGLELSLTLKDDNTYVLSYLKGKVEIQNDSIFDLKMESDKSSFELVYLFDKKQPSDKIKVTLKKATGNYESIFVGTQTANANPEYKSAATILNELVAKNQIDINGEITFDIKNSDYLYLALENYKGKTQISKFKIPVNASEIVVTCTYTSFIDINLQGIYNSKTKELTISENGKSPMNFLLEDKDVNLENYYEQPLEIVVQKNFTFPGKGVQSTLPVEEVTFATDTITAEEASGVEANSETKPYVFSHYKSKSLKESLNHIVKTPKKFLVVVFDLKSKNKKADFDSYIKESETSLTETMYYGYNKQYDFFEYYLATDKDKSLLSKNKIKSDKELLVLNSNGNLIYHTNGNLKENQDLLSTTAYDNAYKGFNDASGKLEFDKVILNKKTTNKEVLQVLKKINGIDYLEELVNVDAVKFAPPAVTNSAVDDAIKAVQKAVDATKVDADDYTKQIIAQDQVQMASDTAVAEAYDYKYDYYKNIKDKKNLYKLQSNYEIVLERWLKIVKEYKKTNAYDKDYLQVLKQELNEQGFSNKTFDKTRISDIDFELLDYVFANYKNILKQENNPEPKVVVGVLPSEEEPQVMELTDSIANGEEYVPDIDNVISNYFKKMSNEDYNQDQKELCIKGLKYYRKYIDLQDFKSSKVRNYMNALSNNLPVTENQIQYFEVFEGYFNKIILPNQNLIESLDADFIKNTDNESDWKVYKESFATDCNQVAWAVVKGEKNTNQIPKAIKWSETSLQLQKDSHYFWDTLGQLYYLYGQKEKAIEAEQKAIIYGKDSESEQEYKEVLEKMKNGNYAIPKN
jgi:hypothetical protein